jgi:hypothetical protein
MKKILLLLLTVFMFSSCIETFRDDDYLVVISATSEEYHANYDYIYTVRHYYNGNHYLDSYNMYSNEKYELGDTIKLIKHDTGK